MKGISYLPKKVKFMTELSFPLINQLYPRKGFIGGRIGYAKDVVFKWLLVKKAAKTGLVSGEKVAMDSTFVKTYSGQEELGSLGFNGHKKAFGFKLHCLLDTKTKFPIALIVTNGLINDCPIAIPLLKKAKRYLKKRGYVLADKGYDDTSIVAWIMNFLKSKAGIPMRKKGKLARGKPHRYGNLLNWKLKAAGRTFKHSILKFGTEIERFFSCLKRKFFLGKELTRRIQSFTRNCYLSLISYALNKFYLVGVRSF